MPPPEDKAKKAQQDGKKTNPKAHKELPAIKEQRVPLALIDEDGKGSRRDFFSHVKSAIDYLKKIDKTQESTIAAFKAISLYVGVSGTGVGSGEWDINSDEGM